MNHLHIRALKRAAELKGGSELLASELNVPHSALLLWLKGKASVPARVFDQLLDILLAADVAALGRKKQSQPPSILVVDDDPMGAYSLARVIKQLGFPVEIANDGVSAIAQARRLRPAFVFLDLRMPGIDGVDVVRLLKAEGLGGHIIAATAYPSELERQRTAAAGFDAHVLKPISAEALKELLAAH